VTTESRGGGNALAAHKLASHAEGSKVGVAGDSGGTLTVLVLVCVATTSVLFESALSRLIGLGALPGRFWAGAASAVESRPCMDMTARAAVHAAVGVRMMRY